MSNFFRPCGVRLRGTKVFAYVALNAVTRLPEAGPRHPFLVWTVQAADFAAAVSEADSSATSAGISYLWGLYQGM